MKIYIIEDFICILAYSFAHSNGKPTGGGGLVGGDWTIIWWGTRPLPLPVWCAWWQVLHRHRHTMVMRLVTCSCCSDMSKAPWYCPPHWKMESWCCWHYKIITLFYTWIICFFCLFENYTLLKSAMFVLYPRGWKCIESFKLFKADPSVHL